MKRALLIGATGGFGGHTAAALLADGWQVRALMREPGKSPAWLQDIEPVAGDASRIGDVRRAAEGVDVIVYGANVPYPRWAKEALPLLEPTATPMIPPTAPNSTKQRPCGRSAAKAQSANAWSSAWRQRAAAEPRSSCYAQATSSALIAGATG
ncbi:MAG: NAD(P)H-binding protein [Acidihalobacter sp.]